MIIVEGPDGAGKSTLVKYITEKWQLKEGERNESNRDYIYLTTRADSFGAMYAELMCTEPPVVWDRIGPISDPIYAPMMDRKLAFTLEEQAVFSAFCRELTVPIIFCLPPWDEVSKNIESSHQMKGVREAAHTIFVNYRDLALYSYSYKTHNKTVYDYTRAPEAIVDSPIDEYLRRRKERANRARPL